MKEIQINIDKQQMKLINTVIYIFIHKIIFIFRQINRREIMKYSKIESNYQKCSQTLLEAFVFSV